MRHPETLCRVTTGKASFDLVVQTKAERRVKKFAKDPVGRKVTRLVEMLSAEVMEWLYCSTAASSPVALLFPRRALSSATPFAV